jgi:hypothetical protein
MMERNEFLGNYRNDTFKLNTINIFRIVKFSIVLGQTLFSIRFLLFKLSGKLDVFIPEVLKLKIYKGIY